MDMDIKALLKNKKAWVGVGAAAGLGTIVYFKRKKSGAAAPGTTGTQAAGATAATGGGTVDTTGTDLASFLGNYSQSLNDQLSAGLDAIKNAVGTGNPTTTTPGTGTAPDMIGGWKKNPAGNYAVHINGGTDWATLQSSLAGLGLNADIQTLLNLNPGLMGDVKNYKGSNGLWNNEFINPIDVQVPLLPGLYKS